MGMVVTERAYNEVSDPARLPREPLVSVLMVTYNHAEWIGAAIEGVVSQDFDGGFELIVGEDCSTDGTRDIVLEYQRRYPHLIRVLMSETNVGAAANHARVIDEARGGYLAFCEGDDYWCHPGKLTAQVAILEADARIAMVHADWVRLKPDAMGRWHVDPAGSAQSPMPLSLLEGDLFRVFYFARILRTCTLMMRASALHAYKADVMATYSYRFEDAVMNAYITSRWRIGYWPEIAAVYRESPGSSLRSGLGSKILFLRSCLDFDTDARARFSHRSDYPESYRWEVGISLLLWAVRARDARSARHALSDLWGHFGLFGFLAAGWMALRLRIPSVRRRHVSPPGQGARDGRG